MRFGSFFLQICFFRFDANQIRLQLFFRILFVVAIRIGLAFDKDIRFRVAVFVRAFAHNFARNIQRIVLFCGRERFFGGGLGFFAQTGFLGGFLFGIGVVNGFLDARRLLCGFLRFFSFTPRFGFLLGFQFGFRFRFQARFFFSFGFGFGFQLCTDFRLDFGAKLRFRSGFFLGGFGFFTQTGFLGGFGGGIRFSLFFSGGKRGFFGFSPDICLGFFDGFYLGRGGQIGHGRSNGRGCIRNIRSRQSGRFVRHRRIIGDRLNHRRAFRFGRQRRRRRQFRRDLGVCVKRRRRGRRNIPEQIADRVFRLGGSGSFQRFPFFLGGCFGNRDGRRQIREFIVHDFRSGGGRNILIRVGNRHKIGSGFCFRLRNGLAFRRRSDKQHLIRACQGFVRLLLTLSHTRHKRLPALFAPRRINRRIAFFFQPSGIHGFGKPLCNGFFFLIRCLRNIGRQARAVFDVQNVPIHQSLHIASAFFDGSFAFCGIINGEHRRHIALQAIHLILNAGHGRRQAVVFLQSVAAIAVNDDFGVFQRAAVLQIVQHIVQLSVRTRQLTHISLPVFRPVQQIFFRIDGTARPPKHRIGHQLAIFVVHIRIMRQIQMGEEHVFAFGGFRVFDQAVQNPRLSDGQRMGQRIADERKSRQRRLCAHFFNRRFAGGRRIQKMPDKQQHAVGNAQIRLIQSPQRRGIGDAFFDILFESRAKIERIRLIDVDFVFLVFKRFEQIVAQ